MKLLVFLSLGVLISLCSCQTTANPYIYEGLFVVDQKVIDGYISEQPSTNSESVRREKAITAFKQDFNYILSESNKLLASLGNNGLHLSVKYTALNILSFNIFPTIYLESGNQIYDYRALALFQNYLTEQYTYQTKPYDFAVFFTGYDLYSSAGIISVGLTNSGSICDAKRGVSVAEFNRTYITALTLTNQLVFLSGGSFDGLASQNIMAPIMRPELQKRWDLSSCTATDLLGYLPLVDTCLKKTDASSTTPTSNYNDLKTGMLDLDTHCARALNDTRSYACKYYELYGNSQPKGNLICPFVYCKIPNTNLCTTDYTPEGTICDVKKRCIKGQCVVDSTAASVYVDPTCVLGNIKEVSMGGTAPFKGSCEDLLAARGKYLCYSPSVAQQCCASCNRVKDSAAPGCEYGDSNVQCKYVDKATACAPQNKVVCCQTCKGYVGKRSIRPTSVPILDNGLGSIKNVEIEISNNTRVIGHV